MSAIQITHQNTSEARHKQSQLRLHLMVHAGTKLCRGRVPRSLHPEVNIPLAGTRPNGASAVCEPAVCDFYQDHTDRMGITKKTRIRPVNNPVDFMFRRINPLQGSALFNGGTQGEHGGNGSAQAKDKPQLHYGDATDLLAGSGEVTSFFRSVYAALKNHG